MRKQKKDVYLFILKYRLLFYVDMHVQCSQRPEGELDPLELELWADVSCLIWILRTESRSPAIAASVVNFWVAQARFVWSEVERSQPIMMGGSVAEEYQAVAWSNISKPGNSNRSKNRVLIPASRFIPLPQESTSSCSSSTTSPSWNHVLYYYMRCEEHFTSKLLAFCSWPLEVCPSHAAKWI